LKKKILLIGSNGFIGRNLNSYLKKHYIIYHINRKTIKKNSKNISCDITKLQSLKKKISTLPKLDYVINLSGQAENNKLQMYNNIYLGNRNIIECFNKTDTIKVFFSTTLVYGHSNYYSNIKSRLRPSSNYSKIKVKTEKLYYKSSNNFLIFRVGNVYDDLFKKKGLLNNLFNSIQNDTIFNVNKMNSIRNYIHADDLSRIIKIILDRKIVNKTLNIGHQNFSNKKIINLFEKIFNKKIRVNNLNKSFILDPNIKISPNIILKSLNKKFKKNLRSVIRKKKNEKKNF